jgi:hypothetical protein
MNEAFGAVQVGEIEGTIELTGSLNGPAGVYEFGLKVSYVDCSSSGRKAFHGIDLTPVLLSLNHDIVFEQNPYMGFADFRAAFSAGTSPSFTVTPGEGSLTKKEETQFLVKFKAQSPGVAEGYLVVETEDFKKTWKVVGSTA